MVALSGETARTGETERRGVRSRGSHGRVRDCLAFGRVGRGDRVDDRLCFLLTDF